MPFEFKSHIRTAYCEQDLVVLDLQADTYHVVLDIDIIELNAALRGLPGEEKGLILESLRVINAIRETRSIYHQVAPTILSGFFEQRWMTPIVESVQHNERCRVSSLFEVFRAGLTMKRTTLGRMAESLMESTDLPDSLLSDQSAQFEKMRCLMQSLNKAFVWDFTGNKCLTYSYALVRLARRCGIPAKLMIGVQTRPFFSHAWVELHNRVVNDASTLKESLVVIMET